MPCLAFLSFPQHHGLSRLSFMARYSLFLCLFVWCSPITWYLISLCNPHLSLVLITSHPTHSLNSSPINPRHWSCLPLNPTHAQALLTSHSILSSLNPTHSVLSPLHPTPSSYSPLTPLFPVTCHFTPSFPLFFHSGLLLPGTCIAYPYTVTISRIRKISCYFLWGESLVGKLEGQ